MRSHKTKRARGVQRGGAHIITFMIKPVDETGWGAEESRVRAYQGASLLAIRDAFFRDNSHVAEIVPVAGETLYIEGPRGIFTTRGFKKMKDGSLRTYNEAKGFKSFSADELNEYLVYQKPTGSPLGLFPPPAPPPSALVAPSAPGYPGGYSMPASGYPGGYGGMPGYPGGYGMPAPGYPGGYGGMSGYLAPPPPPPSSEGQQILSFRHQSEAAKRAAFGEAIFRKTERFGGANTGKITGMLLEGLSLSDLARVIDDPAFLISKVREARTLLDTHRAAEARAAEARAAEARAAEARAAEARAAEARAAEARAAEERARTEAVERSRREAEEAERLDRLRTAAAAGDIGAVVQLKANKAPNITFQLYKKNEVTKAWEPRPKYFDLEQGATNPRGSGGLTENQQLHKIRKQKIDYYGEEAAVYVPRTPTSRLVCFYRGKPVPITAYTSWDPDTDAAGFDMYQVPGGQATNIISQEALTATLNSDTAAAGLDSGDEGFIYEAELTQAEVNKLYAEYFKNETKMWKEEIDRLIAIDPVETLKSKKYTEKVEKLQRDFKYMAESARGRWVLTGSKGPEPVVQKATAAEVQKWQDEATIYANKQVIRISKKIIENLELLLKYDNLTAEKRYKSTYEPILVKYRAALEEAKLASNDIESLRAKATQGFDVEYNSAVEKLAKGLKDNTVPGLDTFITKEEILQFTGLDLERIIKDILFDKLKGYRDAVKAEINTTAFKSQPELKPFIESKIQGYSPRAEVDATKAIIKGYAAANKAGIHLLKAKNDSKIKKDDSLAAYAPAVKNAYAAKRDFLFESAKTNVISKMSNLMMISGSNTYKDAPAYQADLLATVTPIADELAKNQQIEAATINIIQCSDKLSAFKQHSGQCWNDTIAILFLFSDGIGPLTQVKLQDDGLIANFTTWMDIRENENFIKGQAPGNLSQEDLDNFKGAAILYLQALQRRYKNSEAKRTQNAARAAMAPSGLSEPLRRQASVECSLTLEASAVLANQFLLPLELRSPLQLGSIKSASNILTKIREQTVSGSGQLRSVLQSIGYNVAQTAPFIKVLIKFISDNLISVNDYHSTLATNIKQGETLIFTDSNGLYKKPLYTPINSYNSLKLVPAGTSISVAVSVSTRDASDVRTNGHAISFIECGGSQYVYDDNIGKLQSIGWKSMFINNNNEDILHIYAYNFDARQNIISSYIGIWIPSNPTKYFKLQDGRLIEAETLTDPIPTNHKEAFYKIQAKYPQNQEVRVIECFGLIILNRASVVLGGGKRQIRKNKKKTVQLRRNQKTRKQSRH